MFLYKHNEGAGHTAVALRKETLAVGLLATMVVGLILVIVSATLAKERGIKGERLNSKKINSD